MFYYFFGVLLNIYIYAVFDSLTFFKITIFKSLFLNNYLSHFYFDIYFKTKFYILYLKLIYFKYHILIFKLANLTDYYSFEILYKAYDLEFVIS